MSTTRGNATTYSAGNRSIEYYDWHAMRDVVGEENAILRFAELFQKLAIAEDTGPIKTDRLPDRYNSWFQSTSNMTTYNNQQM